MARFILVFSLSCLTLFILINALPLSWVRPINEHTAWILGQTLGFLGMPVSVRGEMVTAKGFAVTIIAECTPIFAVGLYLSFLLASPAPARRKAIGITVGVLGIWAANLVRLVVVFAVGHHDPRSFDTVHVYFGQVFTVCLVLLSCLFWLRFAGTGDGLKDSSTKPVGFLVRFVAVSTMMFFLWLHINREYIWLVDQGMVFIFTLLGRRLLVPRDLTIYYYTFNIVVFISLILATRSVPLKKKTKMLALGLCSMFFLHLLYRVCNTLVTAYHLSSFMKVGAVLSTVGQYLAPILLWLVLVRPTMKSSGKTNQSPADVDSSKQTAPA